MMDKRIGLEDYLKLARIFLPICIIAAAQLACATPTDNRPCNIRIKEFPELRGFRLHMTYDEIQNRFNGFPSIPANKFGLARVFINSRYGKDEIHSDEGYGLVDASRYPEFSGIKRIFLEIVDGQVASIKIIYPSDLKWTSEDEFRKRINETLKINENSLDGCFPAISIRIGINKDYDDPVDSGSSPYIEVEDILLSFTPKSRESKEKEQEKENANLEQQRRRNEFKP